MKERGWGRGGKGGEGKGSGSGQEGKGGPQVTAEPGPLRALLYATANPLRDSAHFEPLCVKIGQRF